MPVLRRSSTFLGRSAIVLLLLGLSRQTDAASDDKKPLVFGSDVALVQVPVFVSGANRGAVSGLRASDFVVKQDGKEVEIVSFRYVDTTAAVLQDEIKEASAARRRFLLLFDKSFTDPSGLARARVAARDFVRAGLADSDLVAVATFDFLRGLRLIANFTEDRRVVEHAIYTLGIPSLSRISDPLAIAADFQLTDLTPEREVGDRQETPGDLLLDVLAALARQARSAEEQSYKIRVGALLDSFKLLGLSLRNVPGRKQVVYFSTGFSSTLLSGQDKGDQTRTSEAIAQGRLWEVDSDARYGNAETKTLLDEALQTLSRADAVVHSVDLSGMGVREQYNQLPETSTATRDASGRESLGFIAAETGGRLFKDANDLAPVMREMGDMTSRYYVLGVQPHDSRADGGFRKLTVQMKRKGLRVSHRPGFFAHSPVGKAAPLLQRQFEAAELLVAGSDSQPTINTLPFRVLIVPVPADTEKQSLGIVVQIPRSSLGVEGGALEMFGYAIARSGQVEDRFAHFLRLEATPPESASTPFSGLSFAGRFDVPPGDYTLKFLAERPTGETSTRFFDVTVPKRQASAGFLLPPLFAENSNHWIDVQLKKGSESGLPLKLMLGGAPFLPRTDVTLRPGRRERLVLVAYDPKTAQDPATDIDIRSVLSDDSGKRFPTGAISVENVLHDAEGRRMYVLAFTPEDIPAGEYTLRVHLGEADSVLQSYTRLKVLPREVAGAR